MPSIDPLIIARRLAEDSRAAQLGKAAQIQAENDEMTRPAVYAGFDADSGRAIVQSLGGMPIAGGEIITNGGIKIGQAIEASASPGLLAIDAMPRVRTEVIPRPSVSVAPQVKYGALFTKFVEEFIYKREDSFSTQKLQFWFKEPNKLAVLVEERNFRQEARRSEDFWQISQYHSHCHLVSKDLSFVETITVEDRGRTDVFGGGEATLPERRFTHRRFLIQNSTVQRISEYAIVAGYDDRGEPAKVLGPDRNMQYGELQYGGLFFWDTQQIPENGFIDWRTPTKYQLNATRNKYTYSTTQVALEFKPDPPFILPPPNVYWREPSYLYETVLGNKIYAPVFRLGDSKKSLGFGNFLRSGIGASDYLFMSEDVNKSISAFQLYSVDNSGNQKRFIFGDIPVEVWQVNDRIAIDEATDLNTAWFEKPSIGRKVAELKFNPTDPFLIADPDYQFTGELEDGLTSRLTSLDIPSFKIGIF